MPKKLKDMCSRLEVQEIVDRSTRELQEEFSRLREERDSRMVEVANTQINNAKDSMMRFIGWGGVVGIAGVVYFFGGLSSEVANMQGEIEELKDTSVTRHAEVVDKLDEFQAFMVRGDRFTTYDGDDLRTELREYSDSRDELIIQRLDTGFENLSKQIEDLK